MQQFNLSIDDIRKILTAVNFAFDCAHERNFSSTLDALSLVKYHIFNAFGDQWLDVLSHD